MMMRSCQFSVFSFQFKRPRPPGHRRLGCGGRRDGDSDDVFEAVRSKRLSVNSCDVVVDDTIKP